MLSFHYCIFILLDAGWVCLILLADVPLPTLHGSFNVQYLEVSWNFFTSFHSNRIQCVAGGGGIDIKCTVAMCWRD